MQPAPHSDRTPSYRPDVDGLRALAVTAVILSHTRLAWFRGGYVGVDVFFVISGYLITQLLVGSSHKSPRQRLAEFYLRRARRILPALLASLGITVVAALLILFPSDLVSLGKYVASTLALLTNVVAWTDGGYFSVGRPNPLLHLWSIAVEEQFYLLFPLALIVAGWALARRRWPLWAALAAASFALCIWASYTHPVANYYWAPCRAWELLLGAAIAESSVGSVSNRASNELLAFLGLGVIALAACLYSPSTRYPGLNALAPCAGAATLIVTARGHSTWVSRLLSLRLLVFTGLISYSLYLWHAPILIMYRYYFMRDPGGLELAFVLAALYLVAAVSWWVIEQPIHTRRFLQSDRTFAWWVVMANTFLFAAGVTLWRSDGFPGRFAADVRALAAGSNAYHPDAARCMSLPLPDVAAGDLCSYGPAGVGVPKAFVWGDSHAMALLPAYEHLANALHVHLYFAGRSSCKPLLLAAPAAGGTAQLGPCSAFNQAMLQAVQRLDPRLVILNAHWSEPDADRPRIGDPAPDPQSSEFKYALAETVRQIRTVNRSLCVIMDVPTLKHPVALARAMARRRRIADDFLTLSRTDALAQQPEIERYIRALQRSGLLMSADPKDALCGSDSCKFKMNDRSLYTDSDHLSVDGARWVTPTLERCFTDIGRPASTP